MFADLYINEVKKLRESIDTLLSTNDHLSDQDKKLIKEQFELHLKNLALASDRKIANIEREKNRFLDEIKTMIEKFNSSNIQNTNISIIDKIKSHFLKDKSSEIKSRNLAFWSAIRNNISNAFSKAIEKHNEMEVAALEEKNIANANHEHNLKFLNKIPIEIWRYILEMLAHNFQDPNNITFVPEYFNTTTLISKFFYKLVNSNPFQIRHYQFDIIHERFKSSNNGNNKEKSIILMNVFNKGNIVVFERNVFIKKQLRTCYMAEIKGLAYNNEYYYFNLEDSVWYSNGGSEKQNSGILYDSTSNHLINKNYDSISIDAMNFTTNNELFLRINKEFLFLKLDKSHSIEKNSNPISYGSHNDKVLQISNYEYFFYDTQNKQFTILNINKKTLIPITEFDPNPLLKLEKNHISAYSDYIAWVNNKLVFIYHHIKNEKFELNLESLEKNISKILLLPHQKLAVSCECENKIYIYNLTSKKLAHIIRLKELVNFSLSIAPDGEYLCIADVIKTDKNKQNEDITVQYSFYGFFNAPHNPSKSPSSNSASTLSNIETLSLGF